jgi:glycosyltransferase involved in cell wall biosynthesis
MSSVRLLHLISNFKYGAAAKQVLTLAPLLARDDIEMQVAVLGGEAPWCARLRDLGVAVTICGWRRYVDLHPFLRFRRLLLSFHADLVHTWDLPVLRAAAMFVEFRHLIVSQALPTSHEPTLLTAADRWLIRNAAAVVAATEWEARRYLGAGVPPPQLARIPLAVEPHSEGAASPEPALVSSRLPANARLLVCVGPVERCKGFRDAIWALDILKYLYDDLHLIIAGEGPERGALEQFARAVGADDRVHFVGAQADIAHWLQRSEIVWVPSIAASGRSVALEAMAAGKPVIASSVGGLPDIIVPGQCGWLVPPGDKAALARQTRFLLDNDSQRRQFGDAGKQRVRESFATEVVCRAYAELYHRAISQRRQAI